MSIVISVLKVAGCAAMTGLSVYSCHQNVLQLNRAVNEFGTELGKVGAPKQAPATNKKVAKN